MSSKLSARAAHAPKLAWKRITRWIMVGQVLGFLVTGIVLAYSPVTDLESSSELQMQIRRYATVAHGSLAWAFCVLFGHTLWHHFAMAWKWPTKAWIWYLGLSSLSVLIALAVTGLILLYGGLEIRAASQRLHLWLGLVWPLLLAVHGIRLKSGRGTIRPH